MSPYLLDLPQELVVEILSKTDPVSLVRCASTSKVLRQILYDSSRLLCIIETYLDGSEEAIVIKNHVELLQHILCHRSGWRLLEWTPPQCIPMSPWCRAYELVGGVFAQMGQNLQVVRLPTRHKEWTMHELGFPFAVRDFAMDPTQDFIALLEDDDGPFFGANPRVVRIHFRTISTNVDHPHSRQNPLQFHIPNTSQGNGIHSALMQTVCDVVAIFCKQGPIQDPVPRVLIYNWKEGSILYDSVLATDTSDFVLLDQTSFLITSIKSAGSIVLYKLHPSRSCLKIPNPTRIATFHLPSIGTMSCLTALHTHAGPIEANPIPDTALKKTDRSRIHVFTLLYDRSGSPFNTLSSTSSYSMYVHQNVFSTYLEKWEQLFCEEKSIKWDDWGPQSTMLTENRSRSHWLRYVHGQRVIYSLSGGRDVEILDFSLAAYFEKSKSSLYVQPVEETTSLVMSPTVIQASPSSVFEAEVKTCLPCRITGKALPRAHYAHMLYEGGIVGVQMDQMNDLSDNLELHIYAI